MACPINSMNLNSEQREAVARHHGAYCCQAIPGTGKTESLAKEREQFGRKVVRQKISLD